MNADIELVIQDLSNQIATLSRDKAIFSAAATQREQENQALKKENEKLKKELAKIAGPVPVKEAE
ncbi:hypothetical protein [Bacillus sp. J33]|uniref:hypothetical protein n=1 Tax=Bacillus sp. J33 TaxID=935836 RepID=UPI00047E5D6D|nr:hypothetical protein [Bacillus sp. J33]